MCSVGRLVVSFLTLNIICNKYSLIHLDKYYSSSFCPFLKSRCIQGSMLGFQGLCCRLTFSVLCTKMKIYLHILSCILHRARLFIFLFFFFFKFWWHCRMCDLRSPVRHWTQNTPVNAPSTNHWTIRGLPPILLFKYFCKMTFAVIRIVAYDSDFH